MGACTIAGRQTAVSSAMQLWESKMMQSKAMEDFRKNNISSSNFVLQLPDNYRQSADRELTGNGRHQMMNAVGQTKSSLMTQCG